MNHSITTIGALIRARANSTMMVTQRQQGHMHVKINLPPHHTQNYAQYFESKNQN